MLVRLCFPIFLLLRNASPAPHIELDADSDQSATFEKTEHAYKTIDNASASPPDTSALPTVASAFWNPGLWRTPHYMAEVAFDESDQSTWSKETDEMVEDSITASRARTIGTASTLPTATRAFWESKKHKEARRKRNNIERDFLTQYGT